MRVFVLIVFGGKIEGINNAHFRVSIKKKTFENSFVSIDILYLTINNTHTTPLI